jgi:hypothetical protein
VAAKGSALARAYEEKAIPGIFMALPRAEGLHTLPRALAERMSLEG